MQALLNKYRDRILVVAAWTLVLATMTLVVSVRLNSAVMDDVWNYLGRPIFVICVFLLIALNLQKISKRSSGR